MKNKTLSNNNPKAIDDQLLQAKLELSSIDITVELKGSIQFKYIRCGKSGCHCAKSLGHGPYPHLQWWDKGKIKTKYLNKKNYEKYKKELEKNKQVERLKREISRLEKLKE